MRAHLLFAVIVLAGGCSKPPDSALLSSPVAPTAPPSLFLASMTLNRRAVTGGDSTEATISLDGPATAATVIALSSDAAAAVVPGSVTVQPGSANVRFSITTTPVGADVIANITASFGGRTAGSRLSVWTRAPNSFWYDSAVGEWIGSGNAGHVTSSTGSVRAVCDKSTVYADVSYPSGTWSAQFHLPDGVPIQPGTWGFSGIDFSRPFMLLYGLGRACTTAGEFTIVTAELDQSGSVRNFVATFKQVCAGNPAILHGELRLTNAPRGPGGATPSRCAR